VNKEEIAEKLEKKGFDEDEAEALSDLIQAADAAMDGDAFSQAQLRKISGEDREVVAGFFEEKGFEETAEDIRGPLKLYRSLYGFYEEEVRASSE